MTDTTSWNKADQGNLPTAIYVLNVRSMFEKVIKQKTVKILTPEVSIANELFKQISLYFHKETVLFHSYLTSSKRNSLWWEIRKGKYKIIIGTQIGNHV